MKKNIYICALLFGLFAVGSCKREELGPVKNDSSAPGPVSNIKVTNLNGAANISYTVPNDPDLLYVKAVYTSKQGVVRETKVSRYKNELTVVGFGDTDTYTVSIYAVDEGENSSSPVNVTVKPLSPTINIVRQSLVVNADFGGINIKFENPSEENIAIVVLSNNALGEFAPINSNYTNLKQGSFSVRNLAALATKFGVYTRDRWGNLSDTLIVTITPLFEELLDRTKMKGVVLPTDAPLGYGGTIAGLFDGNIRDGFYHSGDAGTMPQWFTYDMGVSTKLSRMSYFMRDQFFFALHNPKVVEIWGSNNPNPNGSYDSSWVLLTTFTDVKPSGLPAGQLSQADFDQGNAGESIIFPLTIPKVRYIRFKTLQNWTGGNYVNFYEIRMWGDTK